MEVGKKQNSDNKDWLALYEQCTSMYTKEETDEWAAKAAEEFRALIKEYKIDINRIGYAWSGGKDSVALFEVLKNAGIPLKGGVCALHQNEYPSYEKWLRKNAPEGTKFIRSKAFSSDFLNKHPEYIFPVTGKTIGAYTSDWLNEMEEFYNEEGLALIVCGRRKIDGNFCPMNERGFYLTERKSGLRQYNMIAGWSHSQVLAYIRHHDLNLPPTYFWPNGFRFGTHQWTERRRLNGSVKDTFDEIMTLEPEVVYRAAETIDIAKRYLEGKL